jgi:hypothetical protein
MVEMYKHEATHNEANFHVALAVLVFVSVSLLMAGTTTGVLFYKRNSTKPH